MDLGGTDDIVSPDQMPFGRKSLSARVPTSEHEEFMRIALEAQSLCVNVTSDQRVSHCRRYRFLRVCPGRVSRASLIVVFAATGILRSPG